MLPARGFRQRGRDIAVLADATKPLDPGHAAEGSAPIDRMKHNARLTPLPAFGDLWSRLIRGHRSPRYPCEDRPDSGLHLCDSRRITRQMLQEALLEETVQDCIEYRRGHLLRLARSFCKPASYSPYH